MRRCLNSRLQSARLSKQKRPAGSDGRCLGSLCRETSFVRLAGKMSCSEAKINYMTSRVSPHPSLSYFFSLPLISPSSHYETNMACFCCLCHFYEIWKRGFPKSDVGFIQPIFFLYRLGYCNMLPFSFAIVFVFFLLLFFQTWWIFFHSPERLMNCWWVAASEILYGYELCCGENISV